MESYYRESLRLCKKSPARAEGKSIFLLMPLPVFFLKQFQTLVRNRSDLEEQGLCRTGVPQLILGGLSGPGSSLGWGVWQPQECRSCSSPSCRAALAQTQSFVRNQLSRDNFSLQHQLQGEVCRAGFVLAGVDLSSMI